MLCGLALAAGCLEKDGRRRMRASGVAPLDEARFDEFTTRIAQDVGDQLEQRDYDYPVRSSPPSVGEHPGVQRPVALAFGRRLAQGLNDRLEGRVTFRLAPDDEPVLRADLAFASDAENARAGNVTFTLHDRESGELLLEQACRYEPPAVRAAPRLADGELEIDQSAAGLGKRALREAEHFPDRTIATETGSVVFLDRKSRERYWVQAQRSALSADGRLRMELDVRSRGRDRNAKLRVIFFNEHGRQTEVTPVMRYRFSALYTKTVAITSSATAPISYVCLFED